MRMSFCQMRLKSRKVLPEWLLIGARQFVALEAASVVRSVWLYRFWIGRGERRKNGFLLASLTTWEACDLWPRSGGF